jgi:ferredoxin
MAMTMSSHRAMALSHKTSSRPVTVSQARNRLLTCRVAAFNISLENPKNGSTLNFTCEKGENLLEAALRSKCDIPHLCHTGACGACAARVVEGEFDRTESPLLEEAHESMGFTLLCCSYPKSDMKLLSHQEGDMHTLPFNL